MTKLLITQYNGADSVCYEPMFAVYNLQTNERVLVREVNRKKYTSTKQSIECAYKTLLQIEYDCKMLIGNCEFIYE